MVSLKTLKPHLFCTLLKHQNPSLLTQTPLHIFSQLHEFISGVDPILPSSHPQRKFSTNSQLISPEERFETSGEMKGGKSLDVLFKEAVGLSENLGEESEISEDEEGSLMSKLRKIEGEVRSMKGNLKDRNKTKKALKKEESVLMVESKVDGLYSVFTSKPKMLHSLFLKDLDSNQKSNVSEQDQGESSVGLNLMPMEELLPEVILFVKHLYEKGYLSDANFLPPNKLDFSCFSTFYSRGYLRSVAERFGKDHQEKAKFLSENDIKRLALFGCPSVAKKTAFAAKRLRSYFSIQEDIVCRPCKLNSSCKSKYHTVGKKATDLDLADVMKILTLYGLELVPPQLTIPEEIQDSISRLLKQVVEHFH